MSRIGPMTRRGACRVLAGAACGGLGRETLARGAVEPTGEKTPRPVAAVVTRYDRGLHADVLIGRILEGWRHDGGPGPALRLAALYLDQSAGGDLGREMAARHRIPIVPTIE